MAPKRPAPPALSASASGTAFRKSSAKKRKGNAEVLPRKTPSTKHLAGGSNKGKEKAKDSFVDIPTKSSLNGATNPSEGQKKKISTAKPDNRQNGNQKRKNLAHFQVSTSKEAETFIAKSKPLVQDSTNYTHIEKEKGPHTSYRIVAGSYERLLYGFHVLFEGEDDSIPTFHTMFSFAAHTSCITAIAAASSDSKWLATGAGDETVRVWDLKKKKEVGGLVGHNGTIHSLSFPTRTYLLSADSSGLINLYRTRDWSLLKTLRGHTGKVNACVAHPSGKLALSVGKDGMLRMWDLMRGKGAGAVRLNLGQEEGSKVLYKEEPLDVKWNKSGSRFAVMGRTEVVVYKTDMTRIAGLLVRRDDPKKKFGCVEWYGDDILLTGNETGVVEVYQVNDTTIQGPVGKLMGHTNRVREVKTIEIQVENKEKMIIATTASSDGKIRIFDITKVVLSFSAEEIQVASELQPIGTHDTGGARLTCLDVVGGSGGNVSKSAIEEEEEDQERDGGIDEEEQESDFDQEEMEELHNLLDLVEEAKRQGLHVDGLSEFEEDSEGDEEEGDGGDDDDEDVYGDSELEGLEGESGKEEEKEEMEEEEEEEEEEEIGDESG